MITIRGDLNCLTLKRHLSFYLISVFFDEMCIICASSASQHKRRMNSIQFFKKPSPIKLRRAIIHTGAVTERFLVVTCLTRKLRQSLNRLRWIFISFHVINLVSITKAHLTQVNFFFTCSPMRPLSCSLLFSATDHPQVTTKNRTQCHAAAVRDSPQLLCKYLNPNANAAHKRQQAAC